MLSQASWVYWLVGKINYLIMKLIDKKCYSLLVGGGGGIAQLVSRLPINLGNPGLNPGGGLTRVTQLHEWEGKRLPAVKVIVSVSLTNWCINDLKKKKKKILC